MAVTKAVEARIDTNLQCLTAFEVCNHTRALDLLSLVKEPKELITYDYSCGHGYCKIGLVHLAVKNGWLDVVKDLIIKYNIEPNKGGGDMYTLQIAVEYNHIDIIKYLITEHGCDPMVANNNGNTCLHIAAVNNHFDVIKYLISCIKVETGELSTETTMVKKEDAAFKQAQTYALRALNAKLTALIEAIEMAFRDIVLACAEKNLITRTNRRSILEVNAKDTATKTTDFYNLIEVAIHFNPSNLDIFLVVLMKHGGEPGKDVAKAVAKEYGLRLQQYEEAVLALGECTPLITDSTDDDSNTVNNANEIIHTVGELSSIDELIEKYNISAGCLKMKFTDELLVLLALRGRKMEDIAPYFGMTSYITMIRKRTEDGQIAAMLSIWKEAKGINATYRTIIEIFLQNGCPDIAKSIAVNLEQKYSCRNPSSSVDIVPFTPEHSYSQWNEFDDHQKERIRNELRQENKDIMRLFRTRFLDTIESFEKQNIDVRKLRLLLKDEVGQSDLTRLEQTKDVVEIFSFIDSIGCDWLNYHLLQVLINQYGSDEDKHLMSDYIEKLWNYLQRSLYRIPPESLEPSQIPSGDAYHFVLLVADGNDISGQQLKQIQLMLAKKLEIPPHIRIEIRRGSIVIHFIVNKEILRKNDDRLADFIKDISNDDTYYINVDWLKYFPYHNETLPEDISLLGGNINVVEARIDTNLQCLTAFEVCDHTRALDLLPLVEEPKELITYDYSHGHGYCKIGLVHLAVKNGWLDVVKDLIIKYNIEPNKGGGDMYTLQVAVEYNHIDIIKYLITEHGCDPMVIDNNGNTCLHIAVHSFNLPAIEYLLSTGKVNPFAKNIHGQTPRKLANYSNTAVSLFVKFEVVTISYPVHSYVNVLLLGNPGAGKTTLAQVIIERANGTYTLGRFRNVAGVEPFTAGIISTKVKHKTLGDIILHDFAGHSEYYSSHTAVIENLLQGSGAVFVIVLDITQKDSTKHLQQWLTIVNNEVHKCSSQCHIIVAVSHIDKLTHIIRVIRLKKLSKIIDVRCGPGVLLKCLDNRKLGGDNITSFLDELFNFCQSIRNTSGRNLSLYCHMMYAFLEDSQPNVLSLADIVNSPLQFNYALPREKEDIYEILCSLNSTGLICLVKSCDDASKVWVVVNKQILLAEVDGILFAPKSFKEYRNVASKTGIVTSSSLTHLFPHYDPEMLICFLTNMALCQEINPQFSSIVNLKPIIENDDKLLFFPTLLNIDRPHDITGRVFKFGWCLQCTEVYHFFPPRFFHIVMLHLAYRFSLPKHSGHLPIINRKCTFWRNGIHWFNGKGVETLVEMVDESQCALVLMSCKEGYEQNMISLRKDVIAEVMGVHNQSCPSLKTSEFVIDPEELNYHIDKPTQQTAYNVADIIEAVREGRDFVIPELCSHHLPQPKAIKEILSNEIITDVNHLSIFGKVTAAGGITKSDEHLLNIEDLDDILTFLKREQFANHRWQDLGLRLGLYQPTLEDIDDNCRGNPRRCLMECLAAWLKGEDNVMNRGSPSRASLTAALNRI